MNVHKNARLTPRGRSLLVSRIMKEGATVRAAAQAFGISARTAHRWLGRYRSAGEAGLSDRSSRPHRRPHGLPARLIDRIEALRRKRRTGPQIAAMLDLPRSTVGLALRRMGLGKLKALEPRPPVVRYQRERPGEMIHIDTKKLGRIDGIGHRVTGQYAGHHRARSVGWEHLHVAIDDASRLAYTELRASDGREDAIAFLERALGWFARLGVRVERVMTDNGSAYRSGLFAQTCAVREIKHVRTRPYTPRTNGKAERFIQTSLREWAYARPYRSSAQRANAIAPWIDAYNATRVHSALGHPPLARLNNLLGNDT
jgi:transposase InsO family protein